MLGLVLGLAINQIMLYQTRTVAAEEYNVPQFLIQDMQKNMGVSNRTINNYSGQNTQPQKPIINVDKSVYQQPMQTQNNNYYMYEQVNSYNPNRPEWKDFAPYGWDNVTLDPKEGTYWNTEKIQQATARHYWYDRRQDFERDLAQCDRLQNEYRNACYEKLKIRQANINEQKKQKEQEEFVMEIQRRQQRAMAAQQLQASIQAAAAAADAQRQYELQKTEMTLKYMPRAPEIHMQQPTTYRVYDSYGFPQGYIKQNSGGWQY